jgi:hypothetical protein
MKRQYLGDSKDAFKWDYHDFMTRTLGFHHFQIVWMMTPDDKGSQGQTVPERFPARPEILRFCNILRKSRNPGDLVGLPVATCASYIVSPYKSEDFFGNKTRDSYFGDIIREPDRLVFLDPDNGFEPDGGCSEKHVTYAEVERLLNTISPGSIISVFQHHRRKKFDNDFAQIRACLRSGYATAIYWHSLMFITVASSTKMIGRVLEVNREYARGNPVKVIP